MVCTTTCTSTVIMLCTTGTGIMLCTTSTVIMYELLGLLQGTVLSALCLRNALFINSLKWNLKNSTDELILDFEVVNDAPNYKYCIQGYLRSKLFSPFFTFKRFRPVLNS